MADELPDLSKFDKYLDDEDLEKLEGSGKKSGSGGKGGGVSGSSGGAGSGRGGARRWLWLLIGVAVGVAGTLLLPDLVRPHLPPALRLGEEEVAGLVVEKRKEGERLLLTVDTDRGASLVTFTRRVPEIDLLVAQGDSVTLGLGAYAPLVEDPTLAGVRKGRGERARGGRPVPSAGEVDSVEGGSTADTLGESASRAEESAPATGGESVPAGTGVPQTEADTVPVPDTVGPAGT